MPNYSKLIVTGSIARDEITYFDGEFKDYLQVGSEDKINISFVVNKLEKHFGGTATNIAYNLSLLTDQFDIYGAIGQDSQEFLDFFQTKGIGAAKIIIDQELFSATGRVMTDQVGNQLWNFYYGAAEKGKDLDLSELQSTDLAIISANHPQAITNIQNQIITKGADYLYDPGMSLTALDVETVAKGLDNCTWFVSNEYELDMLLAKMQTSLETLIGKGLKIITTMGGNGTRLISQDQNFVVPAYTVDRAVDPSGAGDAWRAGFMYSLMQGIDEKLAITFGNALASFCVEKEGTMNHLASLDKVRERVSWVQE